MRDEHIAIVVAAAGGPNPRLGRARASNRVDIAYLYYLPFATVFISGDKLHRSTVPLFLTNKQAYLSGDDFKDALAELDQHYDGLPEEIKRLGVMRLATYPPAHIRQRGDAAVGRAARARLAGGRETA